jgi:Sec7-like guanine-nucleotide exchange factor
MKFLIPLALFAAAGVSAQDKKCGADYIVTQCLKSENAKIEACDPIDYDCQCAAYQAVATCYNNCPEDTRASSANNQVLIFCQQASLHGSKAMASKTATVTGSMTTNAAAAAATTAADDEESSSSAADESSAAPTSSSTNPPEGAAANLARNTGGLLLAVAGVVAAML